MKFSYIIIQQVLTIALFLSKEAFSTLLMMENLFIATKKYLYDDFIDRNGIHS